MPLENEQLSLTRQAKCDCGKIMPSTNQFLAFFEFTGEGSQAAKDSCVDCGYHKVAHDAEKKNKFVCHEFKPHGPWEYDRFYCGHAGWD